MLRAISGARACVDRAWLRIRRWFEEWVLPRARKMWSQYQASIGWRLYAMLAPTVIAGIWIGLEARAGLTENASGLIEAAQIKQMVTESFGQVLIQDEASKTMVLFPDDTTAMSRKIKAFDANAALLTTLAKRVNRPGLRAMIRHLRSIADHRLAPADTELSEAAAGGNLAQAGKIYRTRFLPARQEYEQTVLRAALEAERLAGTAQAEMDRRNRASLRTIVLSLVLGIGTAGAGLVLLFRNSIVKPLAGASEAMAAVAGGDLSRKVQVTSRHEIGRVGEAVNAMVESVRDSMLGAARSSAEVAGQAAALHQVSQALEDGSERASAQAAEASKAGEGMKASVQQSSGLLATLATSITRVSEETAQAAVLAGNAVRMTHQTRESVERLAESGKVIDSITEAMNRVAFETNILALNAAIEAARQGEAGRGFAVVAKQIRAMAEQTQEATGEISRRVETVRTGIAASVSGIAAIDESILRLATIAASIAAETKRQGNASAQLESEAGAMVRSTDGISSHLESVVQVMEQTREGAHRTRASAQAVAASVRELDQLLAQFQS